MVELTPCKFDSRESLESALRNIAQFVGRVVDYDRPILEGRLPDGSRIEAVFPPVAPEGPSVSIRRFFKETLDVNRLIKFGAMTEDVAEFLKVVVASKNNVVIAGGTGSGKTSMLNALSSFIPDEERVVTIEDARELQLQRAHVVPLEARPPDPKGRGAITIRDLFRATLRLRPDRIVVGEIRGGEALDLIQAMTSGHGGCMATLHATYPTDTLTRLETMGMMSDVQMPLLALRKQLASAINMILQVSRLHDGSRKVTHITEVTGYNPTTSEYEMRDIFLLTYDDKGKQPPKIIPTGKLPECLPAIKAHGYDIPKCMYAAAKEAGASR